MELRWLQEYEPEYGRFSGHPTGRYVKMGKPVLQYKDNKHWKYVDTAVEIYD